MSASRFDFLASASHAGRFKFSQERFRSLYPEYFRFFGRKSPSDDRTLDECYESLQDHLQRGDTRAAVVVSTDPILVAAFTDELDCIAMLQFPHRPKATGRLEVGSRLLTSNMYHNKLNIASDLRPGERDTQRFQNFHPVIADFFADDHFSVLQRKEAIAEDEWECAMEMGQKYRKERPDYIRDGCPLDSQKPGTPSHLVPPRPTLHAPPDFRMTDRGVEGMRKFLADRNVDTNEVALVMSSGGDHPEVCDRWFGWLPKSKVSPQEYFSMTIEEFQVVFRKDAADRFDRVVMGFEGTYFVFREDV